MKKFICLKCGHEWYGRKIDENGEAIPPENCPRCRNRKWDEPKKPKGGKK